MIVTIIVHSCPKCGSKRIVKNGQDYRGDHKYHCHACNAYATHQCVGKESDQTAHVERWNNSLRQRLARFVRKTLSFSSTTAFTRWSCVGSSITTISIVPSVKSDHYLANYPCRQYRAI